MKILVAEDESNIATQYRAVLEEKSHSVLITFDGEQCLQAYYDELDKAANEKPDIRTRRRPPFDAVVLDYRMPKKDGMEVAREILAIEPKQRVLFASAYVVDTLVESVKSLQQVVELLQKPFDLYEFVDLLEDKHIWKGLEKLNVRVKEVKDLNPSHNEIRDLLEGLRKLQKGRAWAQV
ncbi:MAG TPA: response regulator [Nitrososphaera sp.]|jgi:CheY-like chemotaxis protein|nr:response regulator [Nitrososphaera sp.]